MHWYFQISAIVGGFSENTSEPLFSVSRSKRVLDATKQSRRLTYNAITPIIVNGNLLYKKMIYIRKVGDNNTTDLLQQIQCANVTLLSQMSYSNDPRTNINKKIYNNSQNQRLSHIMTTAVLLLTLYLTNGLFAAVVLTVLTATIIYSLHLFPSIQRDVEDRFYLQLRCRFMFVLTFRVFTVLFEVVF